MNQSPFKLKTFKNYNYTIHKKYQYKLTTFNILNQLNTNL